MLVGEVQGLATATGARGVVLLGNQGVPFLAHSLQKALRETVPLDELCTTDFLRLEKRGRC